MVLYEPNGSTSTSRCHIFNTGKALLNFDCYSLAINKPESRLLLLGNHGLALVNLEAMSMQMDGSLAGDPSASVSWLSDIRIAPWFDTCSNNRPVVEWNPNDPSEYAVAIDRLVRLCKVEQSRVTETHTYIDSHHQRPISTISYPPHEPCWLLTGSLDGQIQIWDTRSSSPKSPAALKFTAATPFSIRRIQWSPTKVDQANQLAVQCDGCIRIFDIRRMDAPIPPVTEAYQPVPKDVQQAATKDGYHLRFMDLEHAQRIIGMDWTRQNHSIVTLSQGQTLRVLSADGQTVAESTPNEQSSCIYSKIRATDYDNLFVCAARDPASMTYGFVGWRCDEEQYLRPLTEHIATTTPSAVVDFCLVQTRRFTNLLNSGHASRPDDDSLNRFLILTWCRDGHLGLVEMDSTFRQAWTSTLLRPKSSHLLDSSGSMEPTRSSGNPPRPPPVARSSVSRAAMDSIQDVNIESGELDEGDNNNAFQPTFASPPNTSESSDADEDTEDDDSANPAEGRHSAQEVTVTNEFNSLEKNYGPYIAVEIKDERRRLCVLRCTYSPDNASSFRVYLILSRHYPVISQLFVRCKALTAHNDEQFRTFQGRIQETLEETSAHCFYHGQLCLHKCLTKLEQLFDTHYKQEKLLYIAATAANSATKRRDPSFTNSEIESLSGLSSANSQPAGQGNNQNGNRFFGVSSSSTRTSDSQLSTMSLAQGAWRTCGARFAGGTHLICFGRAATNQQSSGAAILTALNDGTMNRPQSLPLRSTSLNLSKSRENSTSIEQSNYRSTTTMTSNVPIQSSSNNPRLPMFSAPVRSTMSSSVFNEHQRLSSYRRSLGHLIHPLSIVAIYDVFILLPVSRKLADDYRIDLNNPIDMCEVNEQKTQEMGKSDLARCWRLLGGLLSIQPTLQPNDVWFHTPIAHGLIKHLVSTYVADGDIQSASMFLLTMSQSPYLKMIIHSRLVNEHNHDPVLYAYASLLHRWKYFYKRTQILSQIDHNCQSPAPFSQPTTTAPIGAHITCSICAQPVLGQHFLCAACGHGGHLMHMHEWFSSDELKHRCCPEKDCTCRCILKQQELLTVHPLHAQLQQMPNITGRAHLARQPSGSIRPL